jgi:hypothetical protein
MKYADADRRMQAEVEAAEAKGDRFNLPSLDDKRMQIREDRPQTGEEMRAARLKAQADETTANWQLWLKQTIRDKKGIQLAYSQATHSDGVCPFIQNIPFAMEVRDEKTEIAAMQTFANSETFAPWREHNKANTARYEQQFTILNFLAEFLKINYFDQGDHNCWGISFVLLHNAGFIPAPLVAPIAPEPEQPSHREVADAKYEDRMTKIVVHDPLDNRGYTEFDLERVDARTELRLRRLMEGRIGSSAYDNFLNVKDAQAARDAELAQRVLAGK